MQKRVYIQRHNDKLYRQGIFGTSLGQAINSTNRVIKEYEKIQKS